MGLFYIAMAVAILANLFYHIAQKSISPNANPIVSLMATYLTALAVTVMIWPFYPERKPLVVCVKELNWASILLGFAIVGLEIGFLLAYRAGWKINLAAVVANVAVTLLLIPVGILFFREHLSSVQVLGIVLCILGLILIGSRF